MDLLATVTIYRYILKLCTFGQQIQFATGVDDIKLSNDFTSCLQHFQG